MNRLKYLGCLLIGFLLGLWFAHSPRPDEPDLLAPGYQLEPGTARPILPRREGTALAPDQTFTAAERFRRALLAGRHALAVQLIVDAERVDSVLARRLRGELYDRLEWHATTADYAALQALAAAWLAVFYGDTRVLGLAARAHWLQGEYERAISVIDSMRLQGYDEDAESAWRTHRQLLLNHAEQQLGAAGNEYALLAVYQQLAARDMAGAALLFRLAELYVLVEEPDRARQQLDALVDDPGWYAPARALLARLEREAGADVGVELVVRSGQFFIDLDLAQHARVRLLLDTGASVSALSDNAFNQLRVGAAFRPVGEATLATAGGQVRAPLYRLAQLTLGDQLLTDVDFAILAEDFAGFDGVLGMNALGQVQFEIDQVGGELLLNRAQ